VPGHQYAAVPTVAGHHQEIGKQLQSFGGDGEVHSPRGGHVGDLHRGSLVHMQGDMGVFGNKVADHLGQGVPGLGVVVAMERLPWLGVLCSWESCLMLSTLRRISPVILSISSPAGVIRVRCLPLRVNIWTPSSSSSKRIGLLIYGCEV